MAAITDLSDLINRQTGGNSGTPENIFFHKVPRVAGAAATAPVTGRGASLWQYEGMPTGGATPGATAVPDDTTTGAIPFTAPGGSRDKWLVNASIVPLVAGVFLLYDRLLHVGGLSGTSTADQSVQGTGPATPALTRNTGGAGNIAFYEIYTAIGTTSTTLTMTYTNQAGTGSRTSTINIGATGFREVTRMQRIPLAAGDSGIREIDKVKLTATTGTAGDFGITIGQPLAWIPVGAAGIAGWRDYTTGLPGIPSIHPDACLALYFVAGAATAPEVFGCLGTVEA
jgi:hypothetical protein